jgi:hypothetical protein
MTVRQSQPKITPGEPLPSLPLPSGLQVFMFTMQTYPSRGWYLPPISLLVVVYTFLQQRILKCVGWSELFSRCWAARS